MATLDKLAGRKGKKKETGMSAAVASTEKIRHWHEHTVPIEDLAKELNTVIKKNPTDPIYFGLSEESAARKLKEVGPNSLTEKKQLPAVI